MEISEMHLAAQACRIALEAYLELANQSLGGDDVNIFSVCQWPEREYEALYVLGTASGNLVRIRVDAIPAEKLEEFMRGEPGIDITVIPDDASELMKGKWKV